MKLQRIALHYRCGAFTAEQRAADPFSIDADECAERNDNTGNRLNGISHYRRIDISSLYRQCIQKQKCRAEQADPHQVMKFSHKKIIHELLPRCRCEYICQPCRKGA